VIFFIDPQLDEEARLNDIKSVTLSYTFFPTEEGTMPAQVYSQIPETATN
jgi:cytochrome c oxidase assembly protein subunit 11